MTIDRDIRFEITNILSEEMGVLADVIFDEILESLGIDESRLSRVWAGKFIRLLDKKLPQEVDGRQIIIRKVADLLIKWSG